MRSGVELRASFVVHFSDQNPKQIFTKSTDMSNRVQKEFDYSKMLESCFLIMNQYTTDKNIEVLGLSGDKGLFSLNPFCKNGSISNIAELKECTDKAAEEIEGSSTTVNLNQIVQQMLEKLKQEIIENDGGGVFRVFVVATPKDISNDGSLTKLLRENAELPFCIVFVGMGSGNFPNLSFLSLEVKVHNIKLTLVR